MIWRPEFIYQLKSFLPSRLVDGMELSECNHPVGGIHIPECNLALVVAGSTHRAVTYNLHNECQRMGFYHYVARTSTTNWLLSVHGE